MPFGSAQGLRQLGRLPPRADRRVDHRQEQDRGKPHENQGALPVILQHRRLAARHVDIEVQRRDLLAGAEHGRIGVAWRPPRNKGPLSVGGHHLDIHVLLQPIYCQQLRVVILAQRRRQDPARPAIHADQGPCNRGQPPPCGPRHDGHPDRVFIHIKTNRRLKIGPVPKVLPHERFHGGPKHDPIGADQHKRIDLLGLLHGDIHQITVLRLELLGVAQARGRQLINQPPHPHIRNRERGIDRLLVKLREMLKLHLCPGRGAFVVRPGQDREPHEIDQNGSRNQRPEQGLRARRRFRISFVGGLSADHSRLGVLCHWRQGRCCPARLLFQHFRRLECPAQARWRQPRPRAARHRR